MSQYIFNDINIALSNCAVMNFIVLLNVIFVTINWVEGVIKGIRARAVFGQDDL